MSTVTETPRGWSFIHKGQRYEYPTRAQAQEALYDLQRGKTPAASLDLDNDPVVAFVTALEEWEQEQAQRALLRPIDAWHGADTPIWLIQAPAQSFGDDVPFYFALGVSIGAAIEQRALSLGLSRDQSYALIRSTGAIVDEFFGVPDDGVETHAPSPVIVTPQPAYDAPCVDYSLGDVTIEVLDSPEGTIPGDTGVSVWHGGGYVPLADAQRDALDLFRLLGDPRVKAAIEARRAA
jgi:hypothetical protein